MSRIVKTMRDMAPAVAAAAGIQALKMRLKLSHKPPPALSLSGLLSQSRSQAKSPANTAVSPPLAPSPPPTARAFSTRKLSSRKANSQTATPAPRQRAHERYREAS